MINSKRIEREAGVVFRVYEKIMNHFRKSDILHSAEFLEFFKEAEAEEDERFMNDLPLFKLIKGI